MNAEYYAVYAEQETTHWWFVWRARIVEELLREAIGDEHCRILDAGCGTGGLMARIAPLGETVGLDFSPIALSFARKRGLRNLVEGSIERLPLATASFGCALALDVIEHVDDDIGALRELCRVLEPGGVLIVTVPAYEWLWSQHDVINQHRRRYTPDAMRQLLVTAGFEVERLTGINAIALPAVAAIRAARNMKQARRLRLSPNSHTEMEPSYDLKSYPRIVNDTLAWAAGLENHIWRRKALPFGVSILAVARKPLAKRSGNR
jgi:SAM-dependent methyltransferase